MNEVEKGMRIKKVVMGFKVMREKLVSGEKKQTIREKKTDHWLGYSKGDEVRGYWKLRTPKCELLFTSPLSEDPFEIKWKDFDRELMIRDGFSSVEDANRKFFIPQYGKGGDIVPDKEFVVLRWK